MKKVALFKTVSEDYENAFHAIQYQVVFVEPLQFEFTNKDVLAQKLVQEEFDGVILTSPRAIEAMSSLWDPTKFIIWNTKKVYTVGEASCHKIKLLLGLDALGATSGNAQNLAQIIAKENPQRSKFFFPCGNMRSETLPSVLQSSGMIVDALTVYETKENENLKTDLIELNAFGKPSCLVFFSPSGSEYIYRQLQTFSNSLSGLPHFAIGNSTAHKIENLGVEVAGVAEKPNPDSLVRSVQRYFTIADSQ